MDLILSSVLANSTNNPEFSQKIHLKEHQDDFYSISPITVIFLAPRSRERDTKNGVDRHVVGIPIGLFCVSSFRHHLALHKRRITDGSYDPSVARARNVSGRVHGVSGGLFRSIYTSGWAANRAPGVLASATYDAHSAQETLVADCFSSEAGASGACGCWQSGHACENHGGSRCTGAKLG
ncbi:hypothetical protein BS47DRAFT_1397337 [Hydnum rufescens UP504]|uniref:Uncharacterized protein n=1 Tax=Hydnum rufescens UP504 TaxID=1448309 RepID=A0A9P6ANC9_9AGAM|nr:hypothetical protein BS47DRAFT_1397337 [Hydnum rufescens UP504]